MITRGARYRSTPQYLRLILVLVDESKIRPGDLMIGKGPMITNGIAIKVITRCQVVLRC